MKNSLMIGDVLVSPPVLSAPMAGYTNYAYRELLRRLGGVGLIATEMVSARAFAYMGERGDEQPARLWGVADEPRPLAVQIWDNCPETLEELAGTLARDFNVSVIDLNFGCPAPAIAKRSASGSYLLRDPNKVGELVGRVARACAPKPATAKIRLGLTADTINARDVAQAVEGAGGAALTTHGRTARQMYSGRADWDEIAKVKDALARIPLIGNGDVTTATEAVERLTNYPVDGVMIGRGALDRPWIFREISQLLRGEEPDPAPTLLEQRDLLLTHYALVVERFGVERAVTLMRKFACHYSKGRPGGRNFRDKVCRVQSEEEFFAVVANEFVVEEPETP
ncbi:MAG: tRNA-dihydrouridine synthase [Thermoguttaceae bacterium]|nr:tRNA-dihydrouridine synthase [Thermoguttaceae bacterium]